MEKSSLGGIIVCIYEAWRRNGLSPLMSFAFIEIDLLCKVLVIQLECDRKLLGRWWRVVIEPYAMHSW